MGTCTSAGRFAARNQSREVHVPLRGALESNGYQPLSREPSPDDRLSSYASDKDISFDIIQFAAPIFIAKEGEHFRIKLMRLGSLRGMVRCSFRTEDGSGKAGRRYEETSGEVVFEDGQHSSCIDIQILDSDTWSATLEFKVVLFNPLGCELGRYLKVCRVKVFDSDPFPTGRYAEALNQGEEGLKSINRVCLFLEFWKLMTSLEGNSWRIWVTFLFDQLKNAYVWFILVSSVYMVNVVFGHKEGSQDELLIEDDPEQTAQIIGLMYFTLPLLLHFWKVTKLKMDVQGRCRVWLQQAIVRKYMNYSDASRKECTAPEVLNLVLHAADKLASGVTEVSSLAETFGKMLMLNYFAVTSNPDMAWSVVTMPIVMIIWSWYREVFLTQPPETDEMERLVTDTVSEVSLRYRLIANYFQRPAMNETFAARTSKLRQMELPVELFELRSEFFFDWLGPLCVGGYIAVYSPQVLSRDLPLGTFLATISVFKEVSSNFVDGYKGIKKVLECFDPLWDVAIFLNRSTGLSAMKEVVQWRISETERAREEIMALPAATLGNTFRTDLIPIRLENCSYQFADSGLGIRSSGWLFGSINASIEQGKLIAIMGPHGSGKTILMKILASEVLPTVGQVLMPSHLRCLMVSHQVSILNNTPWQNLVFSCARTADADASRVLSILERLQMPKVVQLVKLELSLLSEDSDSDVDDGTGCVGCGCNSKRPDKPVVDDVADNLFAKEGSAKAQKIASALKNWQDHLSFQECAKIHIARALIMNPEIMVMEKPMLNFDNDESEVVMDALHDHVRNRGLCLDPKTAHLRRPRTCFYSAERPSPQYQADAVWKFVDNTLVTHQSRESVLRALTQDDLNELNGKNENKPL